MEQKPRQPQNWDSDYIQKWVTEFNRRLNLVEAADDQLRNQVTNLLSKQALLVHYNYRGIHILIEKGVLEHEKILADLKQNAEKSLDEVLIQAIGTGNEHDSGSPESGVLSERSDSGNQTGQVDQCDPAPATGDVVG